MRVSRAGDGVLAIAVWSNFDDPSALLQGIRWFWHHAANKIMGEKQNRFTGLEIEIISQRHRNVKIGTFNSLVACTTRFVCSARIFMQKRNIIMIRTSARLSVIPPRG